MRTTFRFMLPALLVGAVFYLVLPTASVGWTLLGWNLNLGQRDVRVYNNFTDPTANDNQTPAPSFPGFQGADMALWKAAAEWGSRLHGNGDGDPTQPGGLGSGAGNFDFTWQGNASAAGLTGDNIISELAGCNGGVLVNTTSMVNGTGWRIRFYSCFTWHDGPDVDWASGNNHYDLQGVGTVALGFALGLGSSSVPGATMFAPITAADAGKSLRTIEPDDMRGLQANYGAAASTKPVITGAVVSGTAVAIDGANFAPTGNEVWFTRGTVGGIGIPIKLSNVPATAAGTRIDVSLPSGAGPGDVLVKIPGSAHSALSNAWPIDPTCGAPLPLRYCTAAQNSTGAGVTLLVAGTRNLAADDLLLFGADMPASQFGIFISSRLQGSTPIGNGVLCVGLPFFRWNVLQADAAGAWSWDPPLNNPPDPAAAVAAGESWNFQLWYRDPAAATGGGADFNFSDGMTVGFCP